MTTSTTKTWTKQLVQDHAQTAIAVELYTLPFYLTALTSITDASDNAYRSILSICIEEMLHLQLAANLCIALDTQPKFNAPKYGTPIPYLDPDNPDTGHFKLINAQFDALNEATLDLMLDIETPSGLEPHRHPSKGIWKAINWAEDALEKVWDIEHHRTPKYPYDSIGEMYDALIAGIHHVGKDNFSWNTKNQQTIWDNEKFKQQINNFDDAQNAIKTISLQGEGKTVGKDRYIVPENYRLEGESDDEHSFNEYSHYERLLDIKKQGLPKVYTTNNDQQNQAAQKDALGELESNFAKLLNELNNVWTGGDNSAFWDIMADKNHGLIVKAQNCWKAGVIPKWT